MSQVLPAALAIDGGNSKTDAALVAADGTLLSLVRGPGMPLRLGEDTVRVIGDMIKSAAQAAGEAAAAGPVVADTVVANTVVANTVVAAHLVACVANADLPVEERQLEAMLGARGWTTTTLVANDTYAVLRAGLDDVPAAGARRHWGVGVTCGTGINCIGIAPDGRTARFLALGTSSGDWGGGAGIGIEAQWHAARAADGRGPQTVLRQVIPAHFGLAEPLEVAEGLHLGTIGWDRIAELAPVVMAAADAGDEVARDLILRLAHEIFLLVRSAITRLGLAAEPVPVVLGGGILASGNPLLLDSTTSQITAEFPAATITVLRQPPVCGAALVGLDLADADPGAKARLRQAFAERYAAVPTI